MAAGGHYNNIMLMYFIIYFVEFVADDEAGINRGGVRGRFSTSPERVDGETISHVFCMYTYFALVILTQVLL